MACADRQATVVAVDLERGIFYRKAIGKRAIKKRQTPAPVPPRLLIQMRRWKDRKLFANCFVEFNGKPVASAKTGFRTGGGRIPRNVARGLPRHLRPPSPCLFSGSRCH
jgi:hypothetical protein